MLIDFTIKLDNLLSAYWLSGRRHGHTRIFIILRKMDEYLEQYHGDSMQAAAAFIDDACLRCDYFDPKFRAEKPLSLEEFFEVLDKEEWGAFSGTRMNKTRYLLLKLDLLNSQLHTRLQFEKQNSSIEHLMPKKLTDEWQIDERAHERWVNRLGNLVIIDRKKNASMSNAPYKRKKEKYQEHIESRAHTNLVFMKYQEWSIDELKHNHARVLSILKKYYTGNSLKTLFDMKK